MLSTIAEIIRELLIFVAVIAALLVALVVIVSTMPDRNPLKRLLTALSYRLGATLAAGAVAIPSEPIPGIDVLYDVGARRAFYVAPGCLSKLSTYRFEVVSMSMRLRPSITTEPLPPSKAMSCLESEARLAVHCFQSGGRCAGGQEPRRL